MENQDIQAIERRSKESPRDFTTTRSSSSYDDESKGRKPVQSRISHGHRSTRANDVLPRDESEELSDADSLCESDGGLHEEIVAAQESFIRKWKTKDRS